MGFCSIIGGWFYTILSNEQPERDPQVTATDELTLPITKREHKGACATLVADWPLADQSDRRRDGRKR